MKVDRIQQALLLSFAVSFITLAIKMTGFILTGATTALSDALESVVHLFAVAFVVYGYYVSQKPADNKHLYGHERIEYLSVGVEGTVIILAGLSIVFHAIHHFLTGIEIERIVTGIYLMAGAAVINLVLGLYVLKVGRQENNMIAISNGKHVLTDVWTSGGVVLTLLMIQFSGWLYLDTVVSLAIAAYIMFEAVKLIRYSIEGIMDTRDPKVDRAIRKILDDELPDAIHSWHHLRHRSSGKTTWVELHLVFDDEIKLKKAHDEATRLERKLIDSLKADAVVTLHLEPEKTHQESHDILRGANKGRNLDDFV
ncbi:MAG: cation diffusion facilitator family transporter [Balneolaceae bacterium]